MVWEATIEDGARWVSAGFKHILNVMAKHPDLFSDLPAIPAEVAIKPGYVFKP